MTNTEANKLGEIRMSDDDFVKRALRNLERAEDTPIIEIEIGHGDNRAAYIIADLDAIFDAHPEHTPAQRPEASQARKNLIKKAAQRYGIGGEIGQQQYERYKEVLAAEERREYRARIWKEQGREVRRILSDPKARAERRAECERKRYADKKGSPVRPYRKLDHMTDAERAAYKKEQKREAQRRRRLEKKTREASSSGRAEGI